MVNLAYLMAKKRNQSNEKSLHSAPHRPAAPKQVLWKYKGQLNPKTSTLASLIYELIVHARGCYVKTTRAGNIAFSGCFRKNEIHGAREKIAKESKIHEFIKISSQALVLAKPALLYWGLPKAAVQKF